MIEIIIEVFGIMPNPLELGKPVQDVLMGV